MTQYKITKTIIVEIDDEEKTYDQILNEVIEGEHQENWDTDGDIELTKIDDSSEDVVVTLDSEQQEYIYGQLGHDNAKEFVQSMINLMIEDGIAFKNPYVDDISQTSNKKFEELTDDQKNIALETELEMFRESSIEQFCKANCKDGSRFVDICDGSGFNENIIDTNYCENCIHMNPTNEILIEIYNDRLED